MHGNQYRQRGRPRKVAFQSPHTHNLFTSNRGQSVATTIYAMKQTFLPSFMVIFICYISAVDPQTSQNATKCEKPHQIYRECGCPLNCENNTEIGFICKSCPVLIVCSDHGSSDPYPRPQTTWSSIRCSKLCVNGCQCDSYYDDGNGSCVTVIQAFSITK